MSHNVGLLLEFRAEEERDPLCGKGSDHSREGASGTAELPVTRARLIEDGSELIHWDSLRL